jgi:hypothetical protein
MGQLVDISVIYVAGFTHVIRIGQSA